MTLADKIGIGIFLFTLLTFCGLFGATFLFKGPARMPVDEADESSYHSGNESKGDSMTKSRYPDDGGLKEPVRPYNDTIDAFRMLARALSFKRTETGSRSEFKHSGNWFFNRTDNTTCTAGHARVFGTKPPKGWVVFRYNRVAPDWALHRVWSFFGLFCVHHVEPGKKYTCEPGWYVTWAKLKLSAAIEPADHYKPDRRR